MRKRYSNEHIVDFLFVLGLFFIFTISAIFLVLIGSAVYKNTVQKTDYNYDTRTSFAYVTEKIRQSDISDGVNIVDFDGHTALELSQEYDGIMYATYLYSYEGKLMELFTSVGNNLPAESGQPIFDINDFNIAKIGDSLYKVEIILPNDLNYAFMVSTRSDAS